MGGHVNLLGAQLFSREFLASVGEPLMKRPLIYLKQDQWEVVFHPLHHLSCHNYRKASFKVQSGGTETGEDHYEPINSLFTSPPYSPARGWSRGQAGWEGAVDVNLKVQQG